ncbi:BamA/TamA family outer membrane protein [Pseudomonadota bacterium]
MKQFITLIVAILCIGFAMPFAKADTPPSEEHVVATDLSVEATPDLTEENSKFKFLSKKPENLLLVPIPTSNPTFGTGLILGGAYFYKQTEEQKDTQPASFTGAAAGYTDNDSWFAGVMQQNHWKEDKWRFTGIGGYLDLKLELDPGTTGDGDTSPVAWLVDGAFLQARLARRLWGNWYLGLTGRYLDISQTIGRNIEDADFNLQSEISATGVGLNLDFDSRDMPYNPYSGRYFEVKAMTSSQSGSDTDSYQSYRVRFRSYHSLADPLVLAWDINGCSKSGQIPLWDTCRLALRGFSGTDYLSMQSLYAQAEIRWRFYKRWGMVAFAGAGRVYDSLGDHGGNETIPSYGVGLRFMALESQRINVRLDYARSDKGNDALYLSVTEAF